MYYVITISVCNLVPFPKTRFLFKFESNDMATEK